MHRVLIVVSLVGVVGCKKSKEAQCDELAEMTIAVADQLAKQLGGKSKQSFGKDPEIKAKMAEFKAQCMQWPDEVFECMKNNDETSPKCRDAMSIVSGLVPSGVDKAPPGPAIVASADLRADDDSDGLAVQLDRDTLFAASSTWVTAVDATGAERWRSPLEHKGWMVALTDGTLLVGARANELVALDRKSGAVRWRIAIPIADGGDEYDERRPERAVQLGNRALVVLSDGRFLRVDPAACATKQQKGCLSQAFALPDETLYEPELVALGDDMVALGTSDDGIRVFQDDGKLLASIQVRDTLGGMAVVSPTRLAVTMDDELVVFDVTRCSANPVVLPRKKGRMYFKGDDECEDCTPPPASCVVARAELDDVDSTTPTVLGDGSIMVTNIEGPARASATGKKHWVAEVDAVGPVRALDPSTVVFVSRGENDHDKAKLVALDVKTGKAKWARPLDIASSDISYNFDPIVEVNGSWLVAGAKGRLSWIQLTTKI